MEAVIDLGGGDNPEFRPPSTRRHPRAGPAALLATAIVLALSGPPTAPAPLLPLRASVTVPPGGSIQLTGGALYLYVQALAGESQVDRYDLNGAVQWHFALPVTAAAVTITESAAVTYLEFGLVAEADVPYVWALDSTTGRKRWTVANGRLVYASGGRALVVALQPDGEHVQWRDARTGRILWSAVIDVSWDLSPIPDGSRVLYALSPTGEVRGLILADTGGEFDARLRTVPGTGPYPRHLLQPEGDTLVIADPIESGPIVGYRIHDLERARTRSVRPAWSASLTATTPDRGVAASGPSLSGCGVVLCVFAGSDAYGLDPVDGRRLWTARASLVSPVGDYLMVAPFGSFGSGSSTVVDPRTGATLLRLGSWSAVAQPAGSMVFVAPTSTVPGGPASDRYDSSSGESAYVGVLTGTGDTGDPVRMRILGTIAVPGFDCRYVSQVLACIGTSGGRLPKIVGGIADLWAVHN